MYRAKKSAVGWWLLVYNIVMLGGLSAVCAQGTASVTLQWNASPDPTVAGYYIYYGSAPGFYSNRINAGTNTSFPVGGLAAGPTYYFTASCFDAAGREGSMAPEISYALPTAAISNNLSASLITYGQPLGAAAVSGLVTNSAGAVVPGTFAFASPATNLTVGTYLESVVFTPLNITNYGPLAGTVSVTVQPAPLTISANAASKTYGQSLTFAGTEFSATGLKNGETVGMVNLVSSGVNALAAAGRYQLYPQAASGGTFRSANYTISYNWSFLVVTPAPLTITAKNAGKTYGQALNFAGTEFTVAGLLNGDTVTTVTLSSPGAASTALVGAYPIIPGAGWSGTANPANYTAQFVNGTLTVNPAAITVTANNASQSYGATNPPLTASYSGFANGDTASVISGAPTLSVNVASNSPVGIYPITAAAGTLQAANYGFNFVSGQLSVTPASLAITAMATNKVYGQILGFAGTEFTAAGLANGETVGSVTLTASGGTNATAAAGNYLITPSAATNGTFNPTNYTIAYNCGVLMVTPAPLTITANNTGKTYGQALNFAGTEFAAAGLLNGDTVTTVTLSCAGAASTAPVGAYPIIPGAGWSGTANPSNYTAQFVNGTLTVNPAAITVTANNASQSYGATNPPLTASYSGFANGDTASVISGAPTLSVNVTSNSPVGIYPITAAAGTLQAANYGFNFVSGQLSVTPASLAITAMATNKIYGQILGLAGTEFTTAGLANGETVGSVILTASGGTNATAAAGNYLITPSAATNGTFNPTNYTIAYNCGVLLVTPAPLTITAKNTGKAYGQALNFAGTEFTVAGLLNGDTVTTVTLSCAGAASNCPVGNYAILPGPVWSGSANPANYLVNFAGGTLTVSRAFITVTGNTQGRTYGATNPPLMASFTGFANGDTASVISGAPTLSVNVTGNSPVGIYPITVAAGTLMAANYAFNCVNGQLSVTPASLTITANSTNKVYGRLLSFTGTEFSAAGLQNGETVGLITLVSSGANALAAAGRYQLYPQAARAGTFKASNYAIAYNWSFLVVTPAPLAITANSAGKTYGQTLGFAGTEFAAAGLVNGDTVTKVPLSSAGATNTAAVGSYAIVPGPVWSGTALPANYTTTCVAGILTVSPLTSGPNYTGKGAPAAVTLNPPVLLPDGSVELSFIGGDDGGTYAVQGSPDLHTWITLTNEVSGVYGLPTFLDTVATNHVCRFYRTLQTSLNRPSAGF